VLKVSTKEVCLCGCHRDFLLLSPSLCAVALRAQSAPPPAVDDYYGIKIIDPYRYMEDITSPQVKDFSRLRVITREAT
jgi:hypothetical protein